MRKLFTAGAIIFAISVNAQELEAFKLGLVHHLTKIKLESESKMINLMNHDAYKVIDDSTKRIFIKRHKEIDSTATKFKQESDDAYNKLRLVTDQFILQLMSDMKLKNKLREYKAIDCYYKGQESKFPKSYPEYSNQLQLIDETYLEFGVINKKVGLKNALAPFDVGSGADLIGAVWGIFKDIHDFRATKIDNVSEILNGLRLRAIGDLSEPDKEEEKKDK